MGNVLIHFRWKELFHEMGLEGERFERMANATIYDPVWNEFDLGNWTDDMMQEAFIKNAPDLEDIPESVRKKLEFVPVENMDEVLKTALIQ